MKFKKFKFYYLGRVDSNFSKNSWPMSKSFLIFFKRPGKDTINNLMNRFSANRLSVSELSFGECDGTKSNKFFDALHP